MPKITVVGGGNGAFAVSSDLALNGHEVTILEAPKYAQGIEEIRIAGGIGLESIASSKRNNGFAALVRVTTDPEEALSGAEVVFVIVPAYAQRAMAEFCAPYLKKEHTVCLMPGNLFGSIEFLRTLRRCGNKEVDAVAEAECLIYTATRSAANVRIRGFKKGLGLGVFPSRHSARVGAVIRSIYPEMTIRNNVLASGVSNPNVLLHVPLVLLNFTNVERGVDVLSYHATFTRGVAQLVEALDKERMALNGRGIVDIASIGEMVRSWYSDQGAVGDSVYEIMTTNPLYSASKLPARKEHRYFTEDIPYGICPISELLEVCGLPNRAFSAAADLACIAWGRDFFAEARSLASMGLMFSLKELLAYVEEGE